jgi:branched-chain amino acid aminotransferase
MHNSTSSFIIFNHQIIAHNDLQADFLNRGFFYGDGFFETILYRNNKFPLLKLHFDRIVTSCNILNFTLSKDFNFENLQIILHQLLKANNQLGKDAVIKINFFRNGESGYVPSLQTFSWIATIRDVPSKKEKINLCFYDEEKKSVGKISQLKSTNALLYVMAAQFSAQQNCDEAIVFNTNNFIADCTNSNLFIIKDKKIITPPLNDVGVNGVARKMLLQNFSISEKSLTANEVIDADEIFLTNAVKLIQPVYQLENKIYLTDNTLVLKEKLNDLLA